MLTTAEILAKHNMTAEIKIKINLKNLLSGMFGKVKKDAKTSFKWQIKISVKLVKIKIV